MIEQLRALKERFKARVDYLEEDARVGRESKTMSEANIMMRIHRASELRNVVHELGTLEYQLERSAGVEADGKYDWLDELPEVQEASEVPGVCIEADSLEEARVKLAALGHDDLPLLFTSDPRVQA